MDEPLNLDLNLGGQNQTPAQETSQPAEESYGNQFLKNVDPNDRPYVEKYIKDWDAGVTQKFQEYAGKLKPYEELGVDIDSVQAAIGVMRMAENDPVGFYNAIKEQLTEMGLLGEEGGNDGGSSQQTTNLPEFEGLPPQLVSMVQGLQKQVEDLSKFKQDTISQAEKQSTQQQLDKLLSDLENKHGKFDQHAVLGRMLEGMNPDDAVKDYLNTIKEFSSPKKIAPPVLGSGRIAVDQVDSSKLKDKSERKRVVADMLSSLAD